MATKEQNPQETAVAELLKAAGFEVSTFSAGAQTRDNWDCDAWRITIKTEAGKRPAAQETFDYYTGIGLREVPKRVSRPYYITDARGIAQWKRENARPVAPHVAGLLHSIVMEGAALDTNFNEWCAEFGYDCDSMKAFNTYQACCDGAQRLRKLIGRELYAKIAEALQDY